MKQSAPCAEIYTSQKTATGPPFESSRGKAVAAEVRASIPSEAFAPPDAGYLGDNRADESSSEAELSSKGKMRWIVGLALVSWAVLIAAVSLAVSYIQ
jgi:hypothetical protein